MIGYGFLDQAGRRVTLREVDSGNWRAVADVAPRDDQRGYVAALGARYLLLAMYEDEWHSCGVYADEVVVGHLMWGFDAQDGSHWLGGLVVDRTEQGRGLGRAAVRTVMAWLAAQPQCRVIRLSYHPGNTVAGDLYRSLGFAPTGLVEDGEIVVEWDPSGARRTA